MNDELDTPVTDQVAKTPKKRKTVTTSMRRDLILGDLGKLDTLTIEAVTAIVNKHMSMASKKTSNKIPDRLDANGVTVYHCKRSNQWFYLEDMVARKDGGTMGYSKASSEVMTAVKRDIDEMTENSQMLLISGDTENAMKIAKEREALEKALEDGIVYGNIKGTAVPA